MAELPVLDLYIPDVNQITRPWIVYVPNGSTYTRFQASRPVYLVPLNPANTSTCYWNPADNPTKPKLSGRVESFSQ